jgi:hypothetical protein
MEQTITQSAVRLAGPVETCGGISSTTIPNNSYGWGRIDAWRAYKAALPYQYYWPLVLREEQP